MGRNWVRLHIIAGRGVDSGNGGGEVSVLNAVSLYGLNVGGFGHVVHNAHVQRTKDDVSITIQAASEGKAAVMSRGCTGKGSRVHVVHLGGFQSWYRGKAALMGREKRTLFVRGRLRRTGTSAVAGVVHVVHPGKSAAVYKSGTCCTRRRDWWNRTGRLVAADGVKEELHHDRLMALLRDLVRKHRGRVGAARELGIDRRTVAACMDGPTSHSPQGLRNVTRRGAVLMSGGCTGKEFVCKLQIGAASKLKQGRKLPYRTKKANTFCGGPVAGICKLQMHVARGVEANRNG